MYKHVELESLGRRLNFHPAENTQRENTHRHACNTDKGLTKGTHGLCAGACAMAWGVSRAPLWGEWLLLFSAERASLCESDPSKEEASKQASKPASKQASKQASTQASNHRQACAPRPQSSLRVLPMDKLARLAHMRVLPTDKRARLATCAPCHMRVLPPARLATCAPCPRTNLHVLPADTFARNPSRGGQAVLSCA